MGRNHGLAHRHRHRHGHRHPHRHRHQVCAPDTPVEGLPRAALVDLLERGDLDTWRAFIGRCRARSGTTPPASLAELRRRHGLTQVELAKRMEMSQSDLSKFERRHDVRLSTLKAHAEALGGRLRIQFEDRNERTEIRIPADR